MQSVKTSQSDLLAEFVYRIRKGGILRVDEADRLGTLCVGHDTCAAIAEIIEQSIGIRMTVASDGLTSISKINP